MSEQKETRIQRVMEGYVPPKPPVVRGERGAVPPKVPVQRPAGPSGAGSSGPKVKK